MSSSQPARSSNPSLPQGLQREIDEVNRRAQAVVDAKSNGSAMLDYLERDVASRRDVKAMRALLGGEEGLPLGDRLYLGKNGFRSGYELSHHRATAKDLRCASVTRRKLDIEAKLHAFGENGLNEKKVIGFGHEYRNRKNMRIAEKTLVVVTAPVWVWPWAAVHAIDAAGRAMRRR